MTGKTQAVRQPSIDELLTSIRQAIHERVSDGPARSAPAVVAPPPARSDRNQAPQQTDGRATKRTMVTSNREGFAGLLGGDVRLEEALARLNKTGSRERAEAPRVPEMAEEAVGVVSSKPAEPKLRPSIEQWTGGRAAAAEPAPVTQNSVSPERVAPERVAPEAVPTAADRLADARKHAAPEPTPWTDKPWQDGSRAAPRATERFAPSAPTNNPGSSFTGTSRPKSDDLLSSQAASAASSAFNRLGNAVANRPSGRDSALDEMTRDCLRPLLKEWLDENLPRLVERLVREEIARVARTGR